jgi:membrane protease YdiL (CAAX protease family)
MDKTVPPTISNDHRLRIFEVALVCFFAMGGNLLKSVYIAFSQLPDGIENGSGVGTFAWAYKLIQSAFAIALLWYVLSRRSKSFFDIGFYWRRKDIFWSFVLWVAGELAFYCCYMIFYYSGFVSFGSSDPTARVGNYLFQDRILFVTILAVLLNPFFEELIVRAYLMTELRQLTNSVAIAIASSVALQTIVHLYQGTPMALSSGAIFLVCSIFYAKTRRILPVILAHLYSDIGALLWYSILPAIKGHH